MNKQSAIRNPQSKIAIVGAGPAGSSLAIRLANNGFDVVVVERKQFPRQKLCGEFISPECLSHFQKLGVLDGMLDAGGDRIVETRFFEMGGRSVAVPSRWFGKGDFALSLSRSEMDNQLLEQAKRAGAQVLDGVSVNGVDTENGRITKITARAVDGKPIDIEADIFVDATGRAGIVTRLAEKKGVGEHPTLSKPAFVGFKAHVTDAGVPKGVCEIYSFPGGYAGLSNIENDLANICFLIKADLVRAIGGDANEIIDRVVSRNVRAVETVRNAVPSSEWLAVSIDGFGTKSPAPAANLFTVGDAASFIDPFTGSGMVMAFESAEVLADAVARNQRSIENAAGDYLAGYRKKFANRLRICSLLRRTAFRPALATGIVTSLRISSRAQRFLARATRG